MSDCQKEQSDLENAQNTQDKDQLQKILQLYISESHVLENLLLKCFNTTTPGSSQQLVNHQDQHFQSLIQEIEKRKQSLNAIQSILNCQELKGDNRGNEEPQAMYHHFIDVSNINASNSPQKEKMNEIQIDLSQQSESSKDNFNDKQREPVHSKQKTPMTQRNTYQKENVSQSRCSYLPQTNKDQHHQKQKQMNGSKTNVPEFAVYRMQSSYQHASFKLNSCVKKLNVKHFNDLLPIKKPSLFAMKACQLLCQLMISFKKDFDIHNKISYQFADWGDIVKFLTSSAKIQQDVQLLKSKIENLEYNVKFFSMLRTEYLKNEKLLNSNKQQLSEGCGLIFQVFLSCMEYVFVVEELRKQNKLEDFKQYFKKKEEFKTIMSNTYRPVSTHGPQYLRKNERSRSKSPMESSTTRSKSPAAVENFKSSQSFSRTPYLNRTSNNVAAPPKPSNESRDLSNRSGRQSLISQNVHQMKRSTSQFLVKKSSIAPSHDTTQDTIINNKGNQTQRSAERKSITPVHPSFESQRKYQSPTRRLINIHQQKISQNAAQSSHQSSEQKKRSSSKKRNNNILQLNGSSNGFKIQLKNIEDTRNNDETNSIYNIREKHISQLNIDFSFCSDGNSAISQVNKNNYSGCADVEIPSPKELTVGIQQNNQINMFFNSIPNHEDTEDEMESRPLFKLDLQHQLDEIEALRLKHTSSENRYQQQIQRKKPDYDKIIDDIQLKQVQQQEFIDEEENKKKFIGDNYYKQKSIQDNLIERIEKELFQSRLQKSNSIKLTL